MGGTGQRPPLLQPLSPPRCHLGSGRTHCAWAAGQRSPFQGLTWSLDRLLGGGVLPFVLNGRGIRHPGGGAALTEMVFQPLDGAVELDRADLEVNSHEI